MTRTSAQPGTGPLAGVKVLELAGLGPGPFCGMLLADLGAEVVRVDRPTGSGLLPSELDVLNRGRRAVAVDLKHPQGPDVVLRLAERADVLIEGFRPGVAERLGVGPEECLARNPALVYGRMTGWGQDGPLAHTAGHDLTYLAVTGVLHAVGREGGPPQIPLNLVGDFGGGAMYLAVGLLAGVIQARGSGRGQVVDAAVVDGSAHLASMIHGMLGVGGWHDQRGVNVLDSGAPSYDVYETADGRHMAVGALEPRFYAELLRLLDLDDSDLPEQYAPERAEELRARLAETFRRRTQREWTSVFETADACVAPVLSLSEAPDHPHLAYRETFVERDGIVQPAPAPRFSVTPPSLGAAPARPGAHTTRTLKDWGFTDVAGLLTSGAVWQQPDAEHAGTQHPSDASG